MVSKKCNTCSSERRISLVGYDNSALHPWAQVVEQKLRQEGYTVEYSAFGDDMASQQDVISFIDLNGPFFHDMPETDFNRFRRLLSSSDNVLWVTKSVQMECEDPRYGMVLGVARTARAEEHVEFGTFEVDEFDDASADALVKVFDKFQRQRDYKDWQWKEYEFVLSDGTIYVGRYSWNPIGDYLLSPAVETNPRTLDITTYGVLDTLRWVQKRMEPLSPDEVEVNMKYIGLNFKVYRLP